MLPVNSLVPPGPKVGSGKLWDDLGSTTFVTKSGVGKIKPSEKRKDLSRRMAESSDDELDFLSSGSRSDNVEGSLPSKSRHRSKKEQPGNAIAQGQELDYYPGYPSKRKLPNFKKLSNPVPGEGSSSTSRSKTSSTSKTALKQTKSYGILATLHNNENETFSGQSSDEDSLGDCAHLSTRIFPRQGIQRFPGLALSPLRGGDQESPNPGTPQSRRECAISYGIPNSLHPHKTSSRRSDTNDLSTRTSRRAGVQSSDSSNSSEATPRAKHPGSRLPERFPFLEPLSISDSTAQEEEEVKGKTPLEGATNYMSSQCRRGSVADKTTSRKNHKFRYPVPSPLSSPVPRLSQTSSPGIRGTRSMSTLDAKTDEDADDESPKRRPQPRPFPMAANQLKKTNCTPRQKITFIHQAYPDNDENDSLAGDLEAVLDDSLLMGESVDPSTLCPFCDEKLPPKPSPLYLSLLEAAKRKAYPDPRLTNPGGLKALMSVYVASCKRHRFEVHQIPEAIAKGWPTDINFGRVRERVENLSVDLAKLVRGEGGARNESIYWTTVIKEVQKVGSRALSGVKGQFESFEKTQPGYYGELGSMILHQTLYNIFPPSSFDAQSITPLTPQEFIQRILVPEAALALIMEDTGQDRARAAQTMRESAGYGVAMFPDTSEGPGVGAGEDIVLERARTRRRELEDEERMEEALLRSGGSEDEHASKHKGTKRPKKLCSATTTDIEEVTAAQRKMKRKKAGSRTDAESGPDGNVACGNRAMSARKSTRAVSSDLEADPASAHASPPQSSPLQAGPNSQFPGSSSPEQTRSHFSKTERRALQSQPKSTSNDSCSGSKGGFASIDVKRGPSPTALSSQRRSDGRSMSAPIDVDDLEISVITDTPSPCAHQPPVPATSQVNGLPPNRTVLNVRGSSDAEEREANFDLPTPKPRPRGRLVRRDASVERHLEPNNLVSPLTEQNQGRDSSVEIIEPPQNRDHRFAWRDASMTTKHERHDWLMNDSSD